MRNKPKLIRLTALGMMTSAITLISVEIIPTAQGLYAPLKVELNIGESAQALKCNNACRRAVARLGRAIWRGRNRNEQQ